MASLYDKLGGQDPIDAAIRRFLERAQTDHRTAEFFARIDIDTHLRNMADFVAVAMGGPGPYRGRPLDRTHAHIDGVTEEDVDAVIQMLAESMIEVGASESLAAEIAAAVEAVRNSVLNRAAV